MVSQNGILAPIPKAGRYLYFKTKNDMDVESALECLKALRIDDDLVVGLGYSLVNKLGGNVAGLREFSASTAGDVEIPSTPADLWCWLKGNDQGELVHLTRKVSKTLGDAFELMESVVTFEYGETQDLTGYEDGTENPEDEEAIDTAFVQSDVTGFAGSSFVIAQRWLHDLDYFESLSTHEQDNTFGRQISDNEEIDDAPDSAHVKRTAQENFTPEAFMVRRSMPWGDASGEGLMFVAFSRSFNEFEVHLHRMSGNEDGIRDALYDFTRPVTSAYFWCPPTAENSLDLTLVKG